MSETSPTGPGAAWSYRPGSWFAVFGPQVAVLLPESERERVIGLWSLVDGGAGFDEVLDGLLTAGLSRLPGFVLVSTDDGPTRVLLRGAGVRATLAAPEEEVVLEGSAGATWTERSVEGVTALTVVVGEEADHDAADLPLVTGLVRVGRVDRPPHVTPTAGAPIPAGAADAGEEVGAIGAPPMVMGDDGLTGEAPSAEVPAPPVAAGLAAPTAGLPAVPPPPPAPPAPPQGPGPAHVADDETADEEPPADGGAEEADAEEADGAEETGATTDGPVAPVPADDPPASPEPLLEDGGWAEPGMNPEAVADMVDADQVTIDEPAEDSAAPLEPTSAWPAPAPHDADTVAPTGEQDLEQDLAATGEVPTGEVDAEDDPATEVMGAGDPLTDPLPPDGTGAPGWVTPWDEPPAPPPSEATEVVPPSYEPPSPPAGDPPPLPVGSWEPVGGFPPPPPPTGDTDHDGHTVSGGSEPPPPPPGIPGQPPAPAVTAQPVAKLLISDGQTVLVDRAVLIGRAPEARRFSAEDQPQLVTVPSRLHEISSTHVEVRPGAGADHGSAVVTDMGSTNGTVLVQPGLGPEDLKPGIAVQLIPGAIINLGDGITIQVTRP